MQSAEVGSGKRPTSGQTNGSLGGGACVVSTGVDNSVGVTVVGSDDGTVVSAVEVSSVSSDVVISTEH